MIPQGMQAFGADGPSHRPEGRGRFGAIRAEDR
jgi:hypothetical protein